MIAAVSPSRGLAVLHSRYPKETEEALRKLGFKHVGDPDKGLVGPGALLDTTGVAVAPWLAVIGASQGTPSWEVGMANHHRRNQVLKWLAGKPPNKDKGDESLENITQARKVWDATFQKEREAFAALGPDWWDEKKNPATYKAHQELVKGIMDADVVLAQAGLYGAQNPTSTQQQARKSDASTTTQTAPAGQQKAPTGPSTQGNLGATSRADLNSSDNHGLAPGTPEFAAEKQRRLDEWRKLKSGDALNPPQ
jgi:hypothetical protein